MARPKKAENTTSEAVKTVRVKPLMGYVLVEPSSADTKTASGIILPETTQEKPAQGKVIAIGENIVLPNGSMMVCPVQMNDTVVYKKWGGDEIKVEGVEYKLVKFEDLMAIVEDK